MHDIQDKDTLAYVGEVPWHGIGKNLGATHVNADTMLREAGLDWHVAARDLGFLQGEPDGTPETRFAPGDYDRLATVRPVPPLRALVREDTSSMLAVVRSDYTILQNRDLFRFSETLISAEADGGIRYEVAGSLANGKDVFIVCRMGDGLSFRRENGEEDEHQTYLVLANHHDGKSSVQIMGTNIRVVCRNTLNWATRSSQNVYRVRHVQNLETQLEECRAALRIEHRWASEMMREAAEFDRIRMARAEFHDFAASVIEGTRTTMSKVMKELADRPKRRDAVEEQVMGMTDKFENGAGTHGETQWDALQGVVEFIDHQRQRVRRHKDAVRAQQDRMADLAWGAASQQKQRAVRLLRTWNR